MAILGADQTIGLFTVCHCDLGYSATPPFYLDTYVQPIGEVSYCQINWGMTNLTNLVIH